MPRWAVPGKAAQKGKGSESARGGKVAKGSESARGSDPAGRRAARRQEAGAEGGFSHALRRDLLGPSFRSCRLRTGWLALRFIGCGWFFAGYGCAIIAWKNQDGQRWRHPAQRVLAVRLRQTFAA